MKTFEGLEADIKQHWNLANFLSALRIVLAPVLLALAWFHEPRPFLYVLIVTLVSDIADGKVARWMKTTSEFGARLDSVGWYL